MLMTRMSIRGRLLVLSLIPTAVILGLCGQFVMDIEQKLNNYLVIGEKIVSARQISKLYPQFLDGVEQIANSRDEQVDFTTARQAIE